jgi:thymidylate kinase
LKIIFEGLDNVGKSTQIEELRKHYKDIGFIVTKSSFIKDFTPEEFKKNSSLEYEQSFRIFNQDFDISCDRLHLGEYVYGNIYRGYSGEHVFDLEDKYDLNKIDDLFLFVFIDDVDNLLSRDDGLSLTTDRDKKQYEIQRFIEAFEKSKIKNKLLINVNNKSIEDVTKELVNFIEEKKCR